MAGGSAGTSVGAPGTTGGWRGMNGAQRRVALVMGALFLAVVLLVMVVNAESSISDLRAAHASVADHLVWSWEWSSIAAWLSVVPALWWATGRLRPPRTSWPLVALAAVAGSMLASAWHVTAMVAMRHVYYAATGDGPYRFFGVVDGRVAYEYRKDVVTFIQFVGYLLLVRWMVERQAQQPPGPAGEAAAPPRSVTVVDGASRIVVPVAEIERVSAAGNYVELEWSGRTLLHRATMAAMEETLGDAFVRIHRGTLVRLDAIRHLTVDRSGDFEVELGSGASVRGSRRYRANLGCRETA